MPAGAVPPIVNPTPTGPAGVAGGVPPLPTADNTRPPVAVPGATGPVAGPPPIPPEFAEQRVGRLLTPQEVLLQLDGGKGEWHRAASGASFNIGDQILTLPTFHPTIILASGVSLQLNPETLVEFQGLEQGIPAIRIHYGRLVMLTVGKADVKIKLTMGDHSGIVTFVDAEATAAAEVRPYRLSGTNPEKTPPQIAITLYGTSGAVQWTVGGVAQLIKAPARLALTPDPTIAPGGEHEIPKWLGAETNSPLDTRAAQMLNQALDEKRPRHPGVAKWPTIAGRKIVRSPRGRCARR